MTAPDLQRVIEEAIAGETEYPVNAHIVAQARAVLAALTEAGSVEWGLRHGNRSRVERFFTEGYAKQCAVESGATVVSRLTLPWTAAAE